MTQFSRPDFSKFVVHFTKDGPPLVTTQLFELQGISKMSAKERLFEMMKKGKVTASRMPWTNKPAVCFTECTWPSLLRHASRYSPYGLGFTKEFLFLAGGGPAFYLAPHLLEKQKQYAKKLPHPFDSDLYSFITPHHVQVHGVIWIGSKYKDKHWNGKTPVDYSHEREWRVPHSLEFTLDRIAFVIVNTYEDMAQAPKDLKDRIGRDNWIILANYRKIEELWPTHNL